MFQRLLYSKFAATLSVLLVSMALSGFVIADEAAEPQDGEPAATIKDSSQEPHQESGHKEAHNSDAGHHEEEGHGKAANGEGGHGDGDHGGAHHNEHDLTHANGGNSHTTVFPAGNSLEAPEEFRYDLAIYTAVVFLCLLAILGKFAWRPIMTGLAKREETIASQIEEAKRNADESAKVLAEHESKLAAAAEEVRELIAEAKRDAEVAKDRIVGEAQELAQREKDKALADIDAAKNAALSEVANTSAKVAFNIAGRFVRQKLTPDDQTQLVKDAIEQMPSNN